MDTIYYVYECVPYNRHVKGLITADKKHWWGIDYGLTDAIKHLSTGKGWKVDNSSHKPGTLLYTSETNPELFI